MTWPFQVDSCQLYCTNLLSNHASLNQSHLINKSATTSVHHVPNNSHGFQLQSGDLSQSISDSDVCVHKDVPHLRSGKYQDLLDFPKLQFSHGSWFLRKRMAQGRESWPNLDSCCSLIGPWEIWLTFQISNFNQILVIDGWGISYEVVLKWLPLDIPNDKSTLVQVMAWCLQATSHYLSHCWPCSMLPYGITRPHWVKGKGYVLLLLRRHRRATPYFFQHHVISNGCHWTSLMISQHWFR